MNHFSLRTSYDRVVWGVYAVARIWYLFLSTSLLFKCSYNTSGFLNHICIDI